MPMPSRPLGDRLKERSVPGPNGCIEYVPPRGDFGKGYRLLWYKRKSYVASRVAWVVANGPIPEAMFVCHKCDNPKCVNPEHLFLGTPADNMRDKVAKGRQKNPLGEAHGRAKLTEADAAFIRSSTLDANSIGRMLSVHPQHVRLIRRRKRIWLRGSGIA